MNYVLTFFFLVAATRSLCFRIDEKFEDLEREDAWNIRRENVGEADSEKSKEEKEPEHELQEREPFLGVVDAIQVGKAAFSALKALGDISRKISIAVTNKGPYDWEGLNTYFFSGSSDKNLPDNLPAGAAVIYTAKKTDGSYRGVIGVISFYIKSQDKTISVLYSVPYHYIWYSNWWNVKITSGKQPANKSTYEDLYENNPFKGDDRQHSRNLGSGFSVTGVMTSSGKCELKIEIKHT